MLGSVEEDDDEGPASVVDEDDAEAMKGQGWQAVESEPALELGKAVCGTEGSLWECKIPKVVVRRTLYAGDIKMASPQLKLRLVRPSLVPTSSHGCLVKANLAGTGIHHLASSPSFSLQPSTGLVSFGDSQEGVSSHSNLGQVSPSC